LDASKLQIVTHCAFLPAEVLERPTRRRPRYSPRTAARWFQHSGLSRDERMNIVVAHVERMSVPNDQPACPYPLDRLSFAHMPAGE